MMTTRRMTTRSGADGVELLEQVVRDELDVLVPPLCRAVDTGDQAGRCTRRMSPKPNAKRALVSSVGGRADQCETDRRAQRGGARSGSAHRPASGTSWSPRPWSRSAARRIGRYEVTVRSGDRLRLPLPGRPGEPVDRAGEVDERHRVRALDVGHDLPERARRYAVVDYWNDSDEGGRYFSWLFQSTVVAFA